VFACLFVSSSSFAQVQNFSKKPKHETEFVKKYAPVQETFKFSYPKATLIGHYATGKIYSLPQDNMPCLVADTRVLTPIPNAGLQALQYSLMLNPYKKEDIIPAQ
ncbi:MAG TPA: hypothetical protein VK484_02925, partial [Ferruginibacter sp.]|nr:hypothetical protein [Ferruginibacter sp.]